MNEQVIIYRSKWEAERDQFFFDNPEYILYIAGSLFVLAGFLTLVVKVKHWVSRRRFFRR